MDTMIDLAASSLLDLDRYKDRPGGIFASPEMAERLREELRRKGRSVPNWPGEVTFPAELPTFPLANQLDGNWVPERTVIGVELPSVNSLLQALEDLACRFTLIFISKDTTTDPVQDLHTYCEGFLVQAGNAIYALYIQNELQMAVNNAGFRPDLGELLVKPSTFPRDSPYEIGSLRVKGTNSRPQHDVPLQNRFFKLRRTSQTEAAGWRVSMGNHVMNDIVMEFCSEVQSADLAAISYSWGVDPREVRLEFERTSGPGPSVFHRIQLGVEWEVRKFFDKLLEISETKWLWLDQISLQQDAVTTQQLVDDIPKLYRYAEVHVLLPTTPCLLLEFLTYAATVVGPQADTWCASIVGLHQAVCKCGTTRLEWATRLWPWQELVLASRIRVHIGLGIPIESQIVQGGVAPFVRALGGKITGLGRLPSQHRTPMYYFGHAAFAGWALESDFVDGIPLKNLSSVAMDVLDSRRTCTQIKDVMPAIVALVKADERQQLRRACNDELTPIKVMTAVQTITGKAKLLSDDRAPDDGQSWRQSLATMSIPQDTPYEKLIMLTPLFETGFRVDDFAPPAGVFDENVVEIQPIELTGRVADDVLKLVPFLSKTQLAHVEWVIEVAKDNPSSWVCIFCRFVNLATMYPDRMSRDMINTMQEATEEATALGGPDAQMSRITTDIKLACSALGIACREPSKLVAVTIGERWRCVLALRDNDDIGLCQVFCSEKRIGLAKREIPITNMWAVRDYLRARMAGRTETHCVSSIAHALDDSREFSSSLSRQERTLLG